MPSGQIRQEDQVFARLIATLVARTGLTDLNDTSMIKGILAANAREIGDIYYQLLLLRDTFDISTAAGADLDDRAREIQPGTLRRRGARRSLGQVIFSRATNTLSTLIIPPGVVVKTAQGVSVRTVEQSIITAISGEQVLGHGIGRDAPPISAVALAAGEAGNIDAATVVEFDQKPLGIAEVTNPVSFVFGRDQETDDEFRTRIQEFVDSLARCTPDALKHGVLGLEDPITNKIVQFAHVFEDPIERGNVTLYIDDGAGTAEDTTPVVSEDVTDGLAGPPADSAVGGEEFLYLLNAPVRLESAVTVVSTPRGTLTQGTDYFLNPTDGLIYFSPPLENGEIIEATYTYFTGLVDYIQRVVNGDPDDRINFPGLGAAGVRVRVLSPVVVVPSVQATLLVARGFDRESVIANAERRVLSHINTRGISGDIIRDRIIEIIMSTPGVEDLILVAPSANLTVLDNEIARAAAANIDID